MTDHVGVAFISLSAVKSIKRFSKTQVEKQEETVFPADLLCHSLDSCFRDEVLIANSTHCNLALSYLTCPVPLPTPRLLRKY